MLEEHRILQLSGFYFNYGKNVRGYLMQIIAFINLLSMLITIIFEYHYMYHNFQDVDNMTVLISYNIATHYTLMKLVVFYFHRHKFEKIITNLKEMYKELKKDEEIFALETRKITNVVNKSNIIFTVVAAVDLVGRNLIHNLTNGIRSFPLTISFFSFDLFKSPIYEIVYLNFTLTVYMVVIGNTGIDCIFWAVGNQLILQLKVLQHRLRTTNMKDVKLPEIVQLINMQENIFENLEELNRVFREILFFQLFTGAISICVIGFQMVTNESIAERLTFVSFLSAILLTILIPNYMGTKILSETILIRDAIYESNWYESNLRIRKVLLMIMTRTEKPFILSTFFYNPSLDNFTNIINTSMSYITILKSFKE